MTDNRNSYEMVKEFHARFGHPIANKAKRLEKRRLKMRLKLIGEEYRELKKAARKGDLIKIADGLGDIEYVVNGMAVESGINLPEVVGEIHRSNMTKMGEDGFPIYREDGKILKGPNYEKPNLKPILGL